MTYKYNFDTAPQRKGSNCYKWDDDEAPDTIPLWVADMDFEVAPAIKEALHTRVDHGVFGYTKVPDSFYEAIVRWQSEMYGWHDVQKDWILYTSGVVPAVSAIIKGLCPAGSKVVVLTPVYNCFFSSIRNNNCEAVEVPLKRTADSYEVDFGDLECALSLDNVSLFLLCNPHNPAGRVWSPEELRKMGDLCKKHNVKVLSDEIHSGIIMPGQQFTPFGSLGDEYAAMSITASSQSKTFNTAGLQIAYIISQREDWRKSIDRAININEVCDVNPFGVIALQVAYNECRDWQSEMNNYVWANYQWLREFVQSHMHGWDVLRLEGTYLAWIDIRRSGVSTATAYKRLLDEAHVRVSPGTIYGAAGEGYLRINLACPRATLQEGMERVARTL